MMTEKLKEFREVAKDIVVNSCHGALLAKGFVPDEKAAEKGEFSFLALLIPRLLSVFFFFCVFSLSTL